MVGEKSKMRAERKKRKIAAFMEIAKLNDEDAQRKAQRKGQNAESDFSENTTSTSKKLKQEKSLVEEDRVNNEEVKESTSAFQDITDNTSVPTPQNLDELRKAYKERRDRLKNKPTFRLKESGEMASMDEPDEQRVPLFMVDVQHLIMVSLLGHHAPFPAPRWYHLGKYNKLSHTVVLAVDGVSLDEILCASDCLSRASASTENAADDSACVSKKNIFPWRLEIVGPATYGSTLIQEMGTIPLSNTQFDKAIKKFGSLENALRRNAVYQVFRALFPVKELKEEELFNKEEEKETNKRDKFERTHLLLTADQMAELGYPLPLTKCSNSNGTKQPTIPKYEIPCTSDGARLGGIGKLIQSPEFRKQLGEEEVRESSSEEVANDLSTPELDEEEDAEDNFYILSKESYKEVGPNSPLFAIDCEMCITGRNRFELTRISVVDEDLNLVYESYVKPHRSITNYLTRFSGITPNHLKDVTTRLSDVQRALRDILPPDAILVGQSLNFDLHALKIMHPYVIDTSIVFNLTGNRLKRTKLSTLSSRFLGETIQCWGSKGHDSIEDATAAMKLVLLKLSKDIFFGDAVLEGHAVSSKRKERLAKHLGPGSDMTYATSVFSHVRRGNHSAIVVGLEDEIKGYQPYIKESFPKHGETTKEYATLLPVDNVGDVVPRACEVMLEQQLCIIHLNRTSLGDKLMKLDKWCGKIVEHAAPNSLCIVVLGGAQSANGACMVHLKNSDDI